MRSQSYSAQRGQISTTWYKTANTLAVLRVVIGSRPIAGTVTSPSAADTEVCERVTAEWAAKSERNAELLAKTCGSIGDAQVKALAVARSWVSIISKFLVALNLGLLLLLAFFTARWGAALRSTAPST